VCALLLAIVALVFGKTGSFEFVHYDDLDYVMKPPWVRQGFTWNGLREAFTGTQLYNWHPLTMLSYLLDAELWGMSPGAFHWTNVVLHGANTAVLFLLLRSLTGGTARSAIVAALFALHPLHVESVAWVAARKDLVSTLFFLLALASHAGWHARPNAWRYGRTVLLHALALMAKPMAVTLPFVLLLLDFWPLGRFGETRGARAALARAGALALEKTPLFALSLASSVVTLAAQAGAMEALAHLSPLERAANAALSYVRYLGAMLWPARLGVLYPMPPHVDLGAGALAAAAIAVATALVLRAARARPWLVTGWLWYLGTLVPVIGLVQVGVQSHADRYTYLPLIGVFVAVVFEIGARVAGRRGAARAAAAAAAVVLAALAARTWVQLDVWKDSETLYRHALAVAPDSPQIHYNLGTLLVEHGRPGDAVPHYRETVRLAPELALGWSQLALSLATRGEVDEAWRVLEQARARGLDAPDLRIATSWVALLRGDLATAETEAKAALQMAPGLARAREVLRRVQAERQRRALGP
jgi:tetratricopeptide (TPR) repeat protein